MIDFFYGLHFVTRGKLVKSNMFHQKEFKDYYGIQYLNGNSLKVCVDSRCCELQNALAIITCPGHFYQYGPTKGNVMDHSYVCFKGSRVEEYFAGKLFSFTPDWPIIKIVAPLPFQRTMDSLLGIHNPNLTESSHDFAVNLLENLLLQLCYQPEPLNVSSELEDMLMELSEELKEQPELKWDFHKEAKRMGISYIYLRTLFRKLTKMPINDFLIEERINKAAQLLLDSNMQISEIADTCGFYDPFYFSRMFKKRRFVSPLKYRQKYRSFVNTF